MAVAVSRHHGWNTKEHPRSSERSFESEHHLYLDICTTRSINRSSHPKKFVAKPEQSIQSIIITMMAPTSTITAVSLLQKHGFPRLSINIIQALFQSNKLSSVQLLDYCNALRQASDPHLLAAYSYIPPLEEPYQQAEQADRERRCKESKSNNMLHGIPVSVKANLAVAEWPLTAGTGATLLCPRTPVGYDAQVVASLRQAGAVFIGQTTMDEFGMGSLGTNTTLSLIHISEPTRPY